MKWFTKLEIQAVGLCGGCESKFSADGDLCWDCAYAKLASAYVQRDRIELEVSSAWKSPRMIQ